jgi:hypothetical protein
VMLLGSRPDDAAPVAVAVLCRHPDGDGALVPFPGTISMRTSQLVATCIAQAFLLDRPYGRPVGSVRLAQPLLRLAQHGTWEQVRTQVRETGWLSLRATCG